MTSRRLAWALACAATLAGAGCRGPDARAVDAGERPALAAQDLAGRRHDVDAALARGETVALVFWQTWCAPCRREAPQIVEAVARHGDAIRFYGVVPGRDEVVDDDEVARTAAAWGYDGFPQLRDRDLALTRALNVQGTPTVLVLVPGGERYRGHLPPADWATLRGPPLAAEPAAPAPAQAPAADEPAAAEACEGERCALPGS